jgi:hypothetical protein
MLPHWMTPCSSDGVRPQCNIGHCLGSNEFDVAFFLLLVAQGSAALMIGILRSISILGFGARFWSCLALILVTSPVRADELPEALIPKLGSAIYSEREGAARALDAMGRKALPALFRAKDAEDPEVRARSAALASIIQRRVLIEPTTLSLDYTDQSIAQIAASLGERSGMAILLVPDNQPLWGSTKVTLKSQGPVHFWTALDLLCDQAKLQVQPSPAPTFAGAAGLVGSIRLVQGQASPVPTSDHGPFRTTLVSIQRHRDLTFQRATPDRDPLKRDAKPQTQITDLFQFSIQVVTEPRLLVSQNGMLQLELATDEKGRSLVPADAQNLGLRNNPYFGMTAPMNGLQIQASLTPPAVGTTSLRILRGTIPVSVATPKPEALVVKLAEATGKTFRSEDAALTIEAVQFDANAQRRTIDLTLKSNQPEAPESEDPFSLGNSRSPYVLQTRFDVVDAQGRSYRLLPSRSNVLDPQTIQLTLALMPMGEAGEPVELRYYDLVSAHTEVVFEFRDLPVP